MVQLYNLDTMLEKYGIKYIFVESGETSIRSKCQEIGIDYQPKFKYWVELSWGSGHEDKYDFAYNDFGYPFCELKTKHRIIAFVSGQ